MPEGFRKSVKLPSPASDHKRLPVQPEHVAAFNEKMKELHETVLMSIKLSMPPRDMTNGQEGGNLDHGSPMSTAGRGHLASPSPNTLSMMTTKLQAALSSTSGTGKDEAFDFFTPLPTGCALKKGDVMISCRHCGKPVSEQELFSHVPMCKQVRASCSHCGSFPFVLQTHYIRIIIISIDTSNVIFDIFGTFDSMCTAFIRRIATTPIAGRGPVLDRCLIAATAPARGRIPSAWERSR
jgi:hypothetical protein